MIAETPERTLERLLESLFDSPEKFRRWMGARPAYAGLLPELPCGSASSAAVFHEAVLELKRHGLVDHALFASLSTAYPRRREEILRVVRVWGLKAAATEGSRAAPPAAGATSPRPSTRGPLLAAALGLLLVCVAGLGVAVAAALGPVRGSAPDPAPTPAAVVAPAAPELPTPAAPLATDPAPLPVASTAQAPARLGGSASGPVSLPLGPSTGYRALRGACLSGDRSACNQMALCVYFGQGGATASADKAAQHWDRSCAASTASPDCKEAEYYRNQARRCADRQAAECTKLTERCD